MLLIQTFPLDQPACERIRRWLGAEGSVDFMRWLVTRDAILSVDAANLLADSGETPTKVDEASQKAKEAAEIRRFINLINSARQKGFKFERCEIAPAMVAVN